MSAETAYLDSSAFVKLAAEETESAALKQYLAAWPRAASSALLHVEALRAAMRAGREAVAGTRRALRDLILMEIDNAVLEEAALVGPRMLRSLDAIHLATARMLGPDLGVIVTYDRRLAEAAGELGLPVAAPA
jgi:uncharacterized protein